LRTSAIFSFPNSVWARVFTSLLVPKLRLGTCSHETLFRGAKRSFMERVPKQSLGTSATEVPMPVCRSLVVFLLFASVGFGADLRTLAGKTIPGELIGINDKSIILN